ncbi:MAG: aspartate--tRNA ligase [Bdellovibrionales bacterium]|jgi:aspartyl-tRNA synthetase|nr:aspartate--tRNA ligase [Bdellovibrionales bacterium]
MKFVSELKRSHYAGFLRAEHAGQTVVLMGWIDGRRDHGGLVFVDIRDREGIVQVVLDPSKSEMSLAKDLRGEFVVGIRGIVRKRPEGMTNKKITTGEVEVEALELEILSEAKTPPFQVNDESVGENLRLKYRYLDIRSQRLNGYLRTRHEIVRTVRNYLSDDGFVEVETPILYKSTPEGARDYLVPSRVNQGTFYALPQSPQTLKQLLMIGGMDRYFQIARCFRDEDLRADRQPEFSQIDIEMSFVDQDDIIAINEKMAQVLWKKFRGVEIGPIPRMTFADAMNRYGCDKPDTRFGLELTDLTKLATGTGFKVFDDVLAKNGVIKGLGIEQAGEMSRAQIDKLVDLAKKSGAKGLVWIKGDVGGTLTSAVSKALPEDVVKNLHKTLCPSGKGLSLIVADTFDVSCAALSALRLHFGRELKLIDESQDKFLWVVDFPLFEYDAEGGRWAARHHPFTSPQNQHMEILKNGEEKRYGEILAKAYDLVCNGHEVGGGSVRIHRGDLQASMFKALGLSLEEAKEKFGFFMEALTYGTPPHAGIAWGVDRLTMILCRTDAIRDVIAFPKTAKATDLMSEAPNTVSRDQLIELGIRLAPGVGDKAAESVPSEKTAGADKSL